MKIGVVFAGQGAQYPGMGKDLYSHSDAAKKIFDNAGEQIKHWCFDGTEEELQQTHITQPTMYTVTMAAYEALKDAIAKDDKLAENVEIAGFAGFSLGEYAALTAAGIIKDVATGQNIVANRGKWMFEAGADENGEQRGRMAAVMADRQTVIDAVEDARGDKILEAVNFNGPKQTVVAGEKAGVEAMMDLCKERKIRAKMLAVNTAFHSPLTVPAAAPLKELLENTDLSAPMHKVYANVTGKDMFEGFHEGDSVTERVADMMSRQAMSPVYWQEIVENMIADGVECFIECGPGKTLSGLIKKIDRSMPTLHVEDVESLEETISGLQELV